MASQPRFFFSKDAHVLQPPVVKNHVSDPGCVHSCDASRYVLNDVVSATCIGGRRQTILHGTLDLSGTPRHPHQRIRIRLVHITSPYWFIRPHGHVDPGTCNDHAIPPKMTKRRITRVRAEGIVSLINQVILISHQSSRFSAATPAKLQMLRHPLMIKTTSDIKRQAYPRQRPVLVTASGYI